MKLLFVLLFVLLFSGCAPRYKITDFWSGDFSKDFGLNEYVPSDSAATAIETIKVKGNQLLEYAKYDRLAKEELAEHYAKWNKLGEVNDYILTMQEGTPIAYYGLRQGDDLKIKYRTIWRQDQNYETKPFDGVSELVSKQMRCKSKALQSTQAIRKTLHTKTRTLILDSPQATEVYLVPAEEGDFSFWGGGIKVLCEDQNALVLPLHKNTVTLDDLEASAKSIRNGDIAAMGVVYGHEQMSEVEYMQLYENALRYRVQYLILKNAGIVLVLWRRDINDVPEFRIRADIQ